MAAMETSASEPRSHRFPLRHLDLETYRRLGERGVFEGHRVELIDGEVVEMSPMGPNHAEALIRLNECLVRLDVPGIRVGCQIPVPMLDDAEPLPDFTVARRPPKGAPRKLEAEPLLLIEISDSTLSDDLGKKASTYARAKVPEYWVVDLKARKTVVHRSPKGGRYSSVQRVSWASPLTSSAIPRLTVTLSEVLW